jgi:hypothetical protein
MPERLKNNVPAIGENEPRREMSSEICPEITTNLPSDLGSNHTTKILKWAVERKKPDVR